MNTSNAAFVALIIMTTSVAGCLGESKEIIDEVPIGTWFDEEGNMYSFFSNGLGEIAHLNDSYWEFDYSASFEVDEFAWERTNNSISFCMKMKNTSNCQVLVKNLFTSLIISERKKICRQGGQSSTLLNRLTTTKTQM